MEADAFSSANSSAFNEIMRLVTQALWRSGYAFSATDIGITSRLMPLLRAADYHSIQRKAYAMECIPIGDLPEGFSTHILWTFALLEPFLLNTQATSKEAWERLYQRIEAEMKAETFHAIWYGLMAWGHVPKNETDGK